MTSIALSNLQATPSLSFTILPDSRQEMKASWRKSSRFLRNGHVQLKSWSSFMPFGRIYKPRFLLPVLIRYYRFCFEPNMSRPFLDLEERFFNEQRAGNGTLNLFFASEFSTDWISVPVIAIFTKFDDLIKQVLNRKLKMTENRQAALEVLKDKFQTPLGKFNFPPSAYVSLESMLNVFCRLRFVYWRNWQQKCKRMRGIIRIR